jgi:hypothetical protein
MNNEESVNPNEFDPMTSTAARKVFALGQRDSMVTARAAESPTM